MSEIISYYLAVIFFYIVDVIQKITSTNKITWQYIFVRSIYTTIITFIITILWKGLNTIPTLSLILELMFDSAVCCLGLYFYIKAINNLNFSNVGSLSIIGIVIQQLYYYIFTTNKLDLIDIPAFMLMSLGTVIQVLNLKFQKGVFFVLYASFFWTIGYILLSRTLQKTDFYWSVPFMELTVLIISAIATYTSKTKEDFFFSNYHKNISYFLLLGFLMFFSSLFNNYSYKHNTINTISFLQLSLMPITFIVSLKLFKEKIKLIELVSFISAVIGFCLFAFKQYF